MLGIHLPDSGPESRQLRVIHLERKVPPFRQSSKNRHVTLSQSQQLDLKTYERLPEALTAALDLTGFDSNRRNDLLFAVPVPVNLILCYLALLSSFLSCDNSISDQTFPI